MAKLFTPKCDALKEIAEQLDGINEDDLTTAEHNIAEVLIRHDLGRFRNGVFVKGPSPK